MVNTYQTTRPDDEARKQLWNVGLYKTTRRYIPEDNFIFVAWEPEISHGNEPLGYIKLGVFLDQLRDY
jgi:hypothetical protein